MTPSKLQTSRQREAASIYQRRSIKLRSPVASIVRVCNVSSLSFQLYDRVEIRQDEQTRHDRLASARVQGIFTRDSQSTYRVSAEAREMHDLHDR